MFAAIAGVTNSPIIPLLFAGATAVVVAFLQWSRPAVPIDLTGSSRAFLAVSVVAAVLADRVRLQADSFHGGCNRDEAVVETPEMAVRYMAPKESTYWID